VNRIDPLGFESRMSGVTPDRIHDKYEKIFGINNSISGGNDFLPGASPEYWNTDQGKSGMSGIRINNYSFNMEIYNPKWEGMDYRYGQPPNDDLIFPKGNDYFYDPFTFTMQNVAQGLNLTTGANWHEGAHQVQNEFFS
jgi:hypothetical protein